MESEKKFVSEITKIDKSSFSLPSGVRAGLFVVAPFLLYPIIGFRGSAFASLGGMWLTNTNGIKSRTPLWVLLVACFTESAAVGLGTLAGTAGEFIPPLVFLGVFIPMLLHGNPRWIRVSTYTAITFAVGVGIPGHLIASIDRAYYSLLGTFWVLLGIGLERFVRERIKSENDSSLTSEQHPDALRNALSIGIASAFGIWVGSILGLPRDFWVIITIIITVQPSLDATFKFTSRMVLGTILGAVIGAAIIIGTHDVYLEVIFLTVFTILMFATRGVNVALVQLFLAPFIIILLNITYAGQANFAEARVIDVMIGGAISVGMVYILGLKRVKKFWKSL